MIYESIIKRALADPSLASGVQAIIAAQQKSIDSPAKIKLPSKDPTSSKKLPKKKCEMKQPEIEEKVAKIKVSSLTATLKVSRLRSNSSDLTSEASSQKLTKSPKNSTYNSNKKHSMPYSNFSGAVKKVASPHARISQRVFVIPPSLRSESQI